MNKLVDTSFVPLKLLDKMKRSVSAPSSTKSTAGDLKKRHRKTT